MFNLIQGTVDRPFHDRKTAPAALSLLVHLTVLGLVTAVPFLYVTKQLPQVPEIMAFVAGAEATAPAPPPPPPPQSARPMQAPVSTKNVVMASPSAAPVEAPTELKSEPPATALMDIVGEAGGVDGGVVGGVVGGVLGGVTGGLLPPLPAPPPPAPGPVRIGGQVKAPALLHRVEPVYPDIAVLAKVSGVVILEATVGVDGGVRSVRVLQSRGPLDKAAMDAVRQWQYSPLVLNGIPTSFVLTVTLNFSIVRS
jgi:periplasmic protein TonB